MYFYEIYDKFMTFTYTGKLLSEALTFATTSPIWQQIVLWITSSVHGNSKLRTCCVHNNFFLLLWYSEQFMHTTCSVLGIFMYWNGDSMNNPLSYCGLVEIRSAFEKDLPVTISF